MDPWTQACALQSSLFALPTDKDFSKSHIKDKNLLPDWKKKCKTLIPTGKVHAPENYFQQKKEVFLMDSFVVRAQIKSSLMSKTGRES